MRFPSSLTDMISHFNSSLKVTTVPTGTRFAGLISTSHSSILMRFKSNTSMFAPVAFLPYNRAGKTRVLLTTSTSPFCKNSVISLKCLCLISFVFRLKTSSLLSSRFSSGVCAISSSGK